MSDHSIEPLDNGRLGNVVHLVSIMLIVLVVMLIVLVVTNILSHVYALTSCGDHSPFVGVVSRPTVGANALTYFLRSSNVVRYKSELFMCSSGGGSARDSDTQVKTRFHSSTSKRISYLPLTLPVPPLISRFEFRFPYSSMILNLLFPYDSPKFGNYS